MVISFTPSKPLKRDHQSLMILTRTRLPSFPQFPIYLDSDTETIIQTVCIDNSFTVTPKELAHLANFTLAVLHDVFHKTFSAEPEKFPYWLAPVRTDATTISPHGVPPNVVDWDTVNFVQENPRWQWSADMDTDILLSRLLYDPWDGKKRYFPIAVDHNLRPSDRPPAWTPRRKWMQDIMNYSLSLSKNSRPKFLDNCDWSQPVLQAECVCLRRNFLDKATEVEKSENAKCVVCPQPLFISSVSCTSIIIRDCITTY